MQDLTLEAVSPIDAPRVKKQNSIEFSVQHPEEKPDSAKAVGISSGHDIEDDLGHPSTVFKLGSGNSDTQKPPRNGEDHVVESQDGMGANRIDFNGNPSIMHEQSLGGFSNQGIQKEQSLGASSHHSRGHDDGKTLAQSLEEFFASDRADDELGYLGGKLYSPLFTKTLKRPCAQFYADRQNTSDSAQDAEEWSRRTLGDARKSGERSSMRGRFKKVRFREQKTESRSRWRDLAFLWRNADRDLWVRRWDVLFIFPLSFEMWSFPFRLALPGWDAEESQAPGFGSVLFLLDVCVDMCYVVDATVSIYLKENGEGSRSVRAKQYFRTTFVKELLPSLLYYIATSGRMPLWFWWAAGLPRLIPRALRLKQYFRQMEMNLQVDVTKLQVLKFTLVIFLACHWVGCCYYWMARLMGFADNTWVGQFEETTPVFTRVDASADEHYLALLYRGWVGLAPNSYRRAPQNNPELLFSVLVMFLAMYLSAYLLGAVLPYIVKTDPVAEKHRKELQDLQKFAEERQLPLDLAQRVGACLTFQHRKNVEQHVAASVELTRSLEVKVAHKKFWPSISRCCARGNSFFRCDTQFLSALAAKLREVYLMPGELLVRSGDMCHELCFVMDGVLNLLDGRHNVVREIRGDVQEMSCMVGELSFFLGIAQVQPVQASTDGDVKLLVLGSKEADELFALYPEQQEVVIANLLADFGLNSRGEEVGWGAVAEDGDVAKSTQRDQIKASLKRRNAEVFANLSYASTIGDVEEVRRLLKRKANVDAANYDGRTTLHMACAEGNARVVELLVESGANKNVKSRWGHTPLQEAVFAKQMHVVEHLVRAGAELLVDDPAGAMCEASSRGDEEYLKLLLSNGVDPNLGDYDARCPLHIAAAEGQEKVVELLLVSKAEVNQKDRWGGTPLLDAIMQQKPSVSDLIRSKGGELPGDVGSAEFCAAAAAGDCPRLRVLHACGVDADQGDYDQRTPLHLAAAEGKVLAVNFLIGVSAAVDVKDRWGATPLDDAIRGGTKYHWICGKMIQGWGGTLGNLAGTEEGAAGLREMEQIDMKAVSRLIKQLIAKGLYSKKESAVTEQHLLTSFEATCQVINSLEGMRERFDAAAVPFEEGIKDVKSLQDSMKAFLLSLTKILDMRGVRSDRKLRNQKREIKALCNGEAGDDAIGHEENLKNLFHHLSTETVNEEELLNQGNDEGIFELYAELDELLLQRERQMSMGRRGAEKIAKQFNRYLMQLGLAHGMFETLHDVLLTKCGDHVTATDSGAKLMSQDGFLVLLHALGMKHVAEEDALDMFDKAQSFPTCSAEAVSIGGLLAYSPQFRELLLGQDQEHQEVMIFLSKSESLRSLPLCELVALAEETQTVTVEEGEVLWVEGQSCNRIVIVQRGELALLRQDTDTGQDVEVSEVHDEAVLGEFAFFTGRPVPWTVRALTTTEVLQIDFERILHIVAELPQLAVHIARALVPKAREEDPAEREEDAVTDEQEALKRVLRLMKHRFKLASRTTPARRDPVDAGFDGAQPTEKDRFGRRPSIESVSSFVSGSVDLDALDIPFAQIRQGMQVIDDSWKIFSNGGTTVPVSMIREVSRYLGEVGSGFHREAFEVFGAKASITIEDWWSCWMHFFDGSSRAVAKDSADSETDKAADDALAEQCADRNEQISNLNLPELPPMKLALWTLGLRFSVRGYILDPALHSMWEPVYVAIAGSTKESLTIDMVPPLLAMLLTDLDFELCREHVEEFLDVFSSNEETDEILWSDIRRVLRDSEGKASGQSHSAFMPECYVFNPQSAVLRRWDSVMRFVAVYHFCMVPVRLTYHPFDRVDDPVLLGTELVTDVLVLLYVLFHFNTAYKNKKSRWVTDRFKIAKAYLAGAFILDLAAAFPFDWQALATGSSLEAVKWMRLPKMLLMRIVWFPAASSGQSPPTGLRRLAGVAAMLLHISACVWSSLGLRGSAGDVTWYNSESADKFLSRLPGYEPRDSTVTMWELYCISLHWVATHTVSSIGNTTLYPKNWAEVIYAICQLSVGMTFYRMVLGQISTRVMQSDQTIISLRSKLGSLDKFISGNGLEKDTTLANEIRRHFHTTQSMDHVNVGSILNKLSRSLQFEMADFLTREHLDRVALFKGTSTVFLDTISVLLSEVHFGPEQSVFEAGDLCHSLYIVIRGSVDKYEPANETHDATVRIGSTKPVNALGEVSFAFGIKWLFSAHASRLHGCVLLRLDRQSYVQALRLYPDDEHVISANALQCFETAREEHSSSHGGSSHGGGSKLGSSVAGSSRNGDGSSKGGSSVSGSTRGNEEKAEPVEVAEEKSDIDSESRLESESDANSDDFESTVGAGMSAHIYELKVKQKNEAILNLMDAAFHGEKDRVRLLLSRSTNVNAADSNQRTALHVAASEGHVEVVQLLLESAADPSMKDAFDNTPLNDAVRHTRDATASVLRGWGTGHGLVFEGCTGAVKMCEAAAAGDLELMRRLVDNGLDVNGGDYDARTPLHLAASNGHCEVVEYLLGQKADVDVRDRFNGTALQDAVRHGHEAMQQLLFRAGCKMASLSSGVEMCEAATAGEVDKVRTLVKNGVNPSIADYDQRTALHLAASTGQVDVLNFLLRFEPRIDYNPVDRIGGTPLDDAHRHQQKVAIQMLEHVGAMRSGDARLDESVRRQKTLARREGMQLRAPVVKQKLDKCREHLLLTSLEGFFQQTVASFRKTLRQALKAVRAMQELVDTSLPALTSCLQNLEESASSSSTISASEGWKNISGRFNPPRPVRALLQPHAESGRSLLPGQVEEETPTDTISLRNDVAATKLKWTGQPFACSSAKLAQLIHGPRSEGSGRSSDLATLQEDVRGIFVQNNLLVKTLAELLAEVPDDPSDVKLSAIASRTFRERRDELRRQLAFTLVLAKHMKTILLHPTSTRLFPAKEMLDSVSVASSRPGRRSGGNFSRRTSCGSAVP